MTELGSSKIWILVPDWSRFKSSEPNAGHVTCKIGPMYFSKQIRSFVFWENLRRANLLKVLSDLYNNYFNWNLIKNEKKNITVEFKCLEQSDSRLFLPDFFIEKNLIIKDKSRYALNCSLKKRILAVQLYLTVTTFYIFIRKV